MNSLSDSVLSTHMIWRSWYKNICTINVSIVLKIAFTKEIPHHCVRQELKVAIPAYILPPSINRLESFHQHWCGPANPLIEPCLWRMNIFQSP
jgi:hypothetical protein